MSNRLTFSLASLILILAMGLVFVPTSVMAHPHSDDPGTPLVDESIPSDHVLADHPTVAITLTSVNAAGFTEDSIDGNEVRLVNAAGDAFAILENDPGPPPVTAEDGKFGLKFTFGQDLLPDGAGGGQTTLAASEITITAIDEDGGTVDTSSWTIAAPVRGIGAEADTVYTAEVTVPLTDYTSIPITIFARVNIADAVQSATRTSLQGDSVPSLGNLAPTRPYARFTIVGDPPPRRDTIPPVMVITEPDGPEANGDLVFLIDVDDVLDDSGANALQASDFTIEGIVDGTAVLAEVTPLPTPARPSINGTAVAEHYTLTVTPDPEGDGSVTVSLDEEAVWGADGNAVVPPLPATFDITPPRVLEITVPDAPDADGKLLFKFKFSEPIVEFPASAIDRSGSDNVQLLDGAPELAADSDPMMPTYTLLVTPVDDTVDTTVVLLIDSVEDMAGNGLDRDYRVTYHVPVTITPPVFEAWEHDGATLTWCEGVEIDDIVMPKARDRQQEGLTYLITDADGNPVTILEADETPPVIGLYFVTVENEDRVLRGITQFLGERDPKDYGNPKTVDKRTYTWRVHDQNGTYAKKSITFSIVVKPYKRPMTVTNVMATKLDAAATVGGDVDRIKLTWEDPNSATSYPTALNPEGDCIPAVTSYIITRQELDTHTEGRKPIGNPVVREVTIKTGDPLEYTTNRDELEPGTYEFTIKAVSDVTRLDKSTWRGLSDDSVEATWRKTGGPWVIVDNPPIASNYLRANQTEDPAHEVTFVWTPPEPPNPDAPINDIADAMALYGVNKTFGGYHIEVTNQTTDEITIYPSDADLAKDNVSLIDGMPLIEPSGRTFHISGLAVGEYTGQVVAWNVVGKGALSAPQKFEIDVYQPEPPPTETAAPDFGDATIDSIVATVDQRIEGRFLPEADDPDSDADELTYSIVDADGDEDNLPDGLEFDPDTRALTGTPTEDAVVAEAVYTYTVTDDDENTDTIPFFITVKSAVEGPPPTSRPTTSLPAKGHIVYVRDINDPPHFGTSNPLIAEWPGTAEMPNLWELFSEGGGGSLQLNVSGVDARKVVFSEMMWAVDEGQVGQDGYAANQWFELHNTTDADIDINRITFAVKADGRPALAQGTDLISNVVGAGADWIKDGKGQNGNSGAADGSGQKEFISMFRKELGKEGWNPGHWAQSTQVYHPNHKGTPGRGEPKGPAVVGTTNANRGPIIFNEIANHSNPDYEWIEIKNVSGGDVNLKNYEVTIITAVGTDNDLIDFTGADRNIPAGGILLVVKKDPAGDSDHPLAAGWNFGVRNTWTVAKPGEANYVPGVNENSARYMVASTFNAMPDDGNFVLVMRNRQDRNKSTGDNNIRDVAGYHSDLKVDDGSLFTNLWPLSNFPAPNWDNNKLASGTVQRRQFSDIDGTKSKDKNQNDKTAFRDDDNRWTGIGYKRNAAATNQNGGTPGYPHGVLRSNDTDANTSVIISEVMPTQGDRNLPEWIELRNLSQTIGVNVDNWRLTITNHDSSDGEGGTYDGDLNHTIDISGRIPPGQSYLIVARNSRNTTNLPSERIHNARRTRNQLLLNPYGFEIKLESKKDNNYLHVDTVGNLGDAEGRRSRSFAPVSWILPASTDESGNRISLVRRIAKDGMPLDPDGTMKGALISFEMSKQVTDDETHYGHSSDMGSPGHSRGGVLPVSLSHFRPERMKDTGEIVIRWVTESELNNAGFNILRGEALDGEFTKINTSLIAGKGTTSEKSAYEFVDKSAKPNVRYYYQIQDVSLDGKVTTLRTTHLRGNVTAVGKLTTTWGEIKALQ